MHVIDARDSERTDKFEIFIVETEELIHSKKGGRGMAVSDATRNKIAKKINKELVKQRKLREEYNRKKLNC